MAITQLLHCLREPSGSALTIAACTRCACAPVPVQVLCIAVVLNSVFNAYQLRKSSNILASFKNLIPVECRALRAGSWVTRQASELQRGDVVQIQMGQKVPADLRLLDVSHLLLDNSMLTGESEPVRCTTKCTSRNVLETHNMAFFGSMVVEGSALGVVVDIGDDTVMGRISQLTGRTTTKRTTLQVEIDRFVLIILALIFVMGTVACLTWAFWVRESYPDFMSVPSLIKFQSKIDRNFIFHPLVQGVADGWASTAYGTNTPDGACWMVGSAGSIGLGCGQEGQGYFHFQPRIFHVTPNCRMSSLMVVLQTSLPTVFTPIISSSYVHFSS